MDKKKISSVYSLCFLDNGSHPYAAVFSINNVVGGLAGLACVAVDLFSLSSIVPLPWSVNITKENGN